MRTVQSVFSTCLNVVKNFQIKEIDTLVKNKIDFGN